MALAMNNDESDLAQRIRDLGLGSSQYERDGHTVTVKSLSAEVIDHHGRKAMLAQQTITVDHPTEEYCDATGRLLFIPLKLELHGDRLFVGLEVQRCNEHPQHDSTLEKILDSLRVLRDE